MRTEPAYNGKDCSPEDAKKNADLLGNDSSNKAKGLRGSVGKTKSKSQTKDPSSPCFEDPNKVMENQTYEENPEYGKYPSAKEGQYFSNGPGSNGNPNSTAFNFNNNTSFTGKENDSKKLAAKASTKANSKSQVDLDPRASHQASDMLNNLLHDAKSQTKKSGFADPTSTKSTKSHHSVPPQNSKNSNPKASPNKKGYHGIQIQIPEGVNTISPMNRLTPNARKSPITKNSHHTVLPSQAQQQPHNEYNSIKGTNNSNSHKNSFINSLKNNRNSNLLGQSGISNLKDQLGGVLENCAVTNVLQAKNENLSLGVKNLAKG